MSIENMQYKVVVNHEDQYALWIHGKPNAPGWKDTGVVGSKSECLAYVNMVWTDMRPLSLRKAMERVSASIMKPVQTALCAA